GRIGFPIRILYCSHQNDDWVSGGVLIPQKLRSVRSATFFTTQKLSVSFSQCRCRRARGGWLRFWAEFCYPIRNGNIFRPDTYNGVTDLYFGDPQSSASRISTNPTNRGSKSDLH